MAALLWRSQKRRKTFETPLLVASRSACFSCTLVHFGRCLHLAIVPFGSVDHYLGWVSDLSSYPASTSQHGPCLLPDKGASDEWPCNSDRFHFAFVATTCSRHRSLAPWLVLPGTYDHFGSPLPALYFSLWHVAIRRTEWVIGCMRGHDWTLPTASTQPWCMAHDRLSLPVCLDRTPCCSFKSLFIRCLGGLVLSRLKAKLLSRPFTPHPAR
jgi:hypothetical protein